MGDKHTNTANKRRLRKRGKSVTSMAKHKGGHGGKAFAKSERAAKINEISVAKQMPLMSEFSSYSVWGTEAPRWTRMLYNRPISLAVDYFAVNLKNSEFRKDSEASCLPKHKSKSETDENEEAIKKGVVYEPIDYGRACKVFK